MEEMEEKQIKGKIKLSTILVIILLGVLIIVGSVYIVMQTFSDNSKDNNIENIEINTNVQETTKITFTEKTFPKVDGATAMLPMIGEMTKAQLGYTDEQAQKYLDENTQGKSAKVYAGLINKQTDVIFASEPSDDILRQAKEAGVEFDMVGIGYDGFVFLLNKENPVSSLTLEQIQKIYTGEIKNWKEVGGDDNVIYAYQREANSGSQNLMEKMVMKGKKIQAQSPTSLEIASMSGLIDAVASYENSKYSIGYSIYLYAKEQYVRDSVKFLKINGVEPSDKTISEGTYPLTKVVYAICRKDEPKDSNARKLVEWLKTQEGQKVVVAGGYSPLSSH